MVPVTPGTSDDHIAISIIMSSAINMKFQGQSCNVHLEAPITLAALRAAVASEFGNVDARSGSSDRLCFVYHDSEGEDITIRLDSELALALRLCEGVLEIKATLADGEQDVLEVGLLYTMI